MSESKPLKRNLEKDQKYLATKLQFENMKDGIEYMKERRKEIKRIAKNALNEAIAERAFNKELVQVMENALGYIDREHIASFKQTLDLAKERIAENEQ